MLNELPKKQKVKKPLTKWRLFWRIQKVCFLRAVTPFMKVTSYSMVGLSHKNTRATRAPPSPLPRLQSFRQELRGRLP